MAELVDARDSKSRFLGSMGSIPIAGTFCILSDLGRNDRVLFCGWVIAGEWPQLACYSTFEGGPLRGGGAGEVGEAQVIGKND